MSSKYQNEEPVLEVTPGDVTIGKEGNVEIINARLAELVKAAVRMEKGHAVPALEATNTYACNANLYQCGKAAEAVKK